ncbi:hypothetical protein [Mucilaginibacter sp. OK283]|jgi:hypothetical protein|uniref:hypothetical protein n=1 Tax=Mucilaginibacter sp. OK283 TaxID=1881049 RepID=UPI0008D4D880|nr:hypothetical protein [Mucilaginibacter sp. OK283]SEO79029.1 hypothetical protein SAMN05428947_10491 [Mucilaginibacter sp. OK283]
MENTAIIRGVRRQTKPLAGRRGGTTQPASKRTARHSRNGFLNYRFLPFYTYNGDRSRAEMEYFRSLSNICTYYDLNVPDVSSLTFPQNIFSSWENVAGQIKAIDKKMDCIIVQDVDHVATLATLKRLNTGSTLFYVPVRPLWHWGQVAEQEHIAELVTALFAYLYQIVKMPFYAEDNSYLKYQYDTLFEWVTEQVDEDDKDEKEFKELELDTLYLMQNAGIHILRSISDPNWMERMESVVIAYADLPEKDLEWALLAIDFLQLYQQYPDRSVFDHIRPDLYHLDEEDRIQAEEYISFYWSGNDCFTDTLDDLINTNFQEIAVMDEPIAVQMFDTLNETVPEDFDFETRLFDLLNKLSTLLHQYDHEEREPTV